MNRKIFFIVPALLLCLAGLAQPTQPFTNVHSHYLKAKEYFVKQEYALAYPLMKELMRQYPANTASNHSYINDDIRYYYITCGLKLLQESSVTEAKDYIAGTTNEPRVQLMSYQLAHYYFLKDDFENAISYFEKAGYDNLSNDEIADAKFEMAYAYFNLKQFAQARPLFDEIHQLPDNKYYIPANYYYGFISYYDKKYDKALSAFRLVETHPDYKGVVPYYIAEIFYFQGKKDEALRYGESVLARGGGLYYEKQLKLLLGQLYFEQQNYDKALPLLQDYVSNTDKVSKEVLYELSFCYYKKNNFNKAIEGFKQLSNEKDSMGQNSMYLLGDLYLKTGQKANARNAFQYSAYNSSNKVQQRESRFNYAKLSYELGYQDVALKEMKAYLNDYPQSTNDAEAKEILVQLLTNTNNFQEALVLYEGFGTPTASMQKAYPRILYGRAIEWINDGQLAQADELLNKVIDNRLAGNLVAYAHFWKAEIAYRNQQYTDAIRYANVFLQGNVAAQGEASQSAAHYIVGYSWLYKEDYRNALAAFNQVSSQSANATNALQQDAYLRSADCSFMLRDYTRAGSMYQQVIAKAWPASDYATYQKAMIAGIKNPAEKINILSSIAKQYPSSSLLQDVNMEIALSYIADEKFTLAIPYLSKIIQSGNNALKPRAYLKLGLSYYNSNNNKDALLQYEKLIQQYPQSEEATEAIAIVKDIYIEEGRPNDYVELMKRNGISVSAGEADSLTYASAIMRYNNSNDCNAAITAFSNYIQAYPSGMYVVEAAYLKADCLQKNKQWKEALQSYSFVSQKGLSKYYEKATLEAARINYFELKDYAAAKNYFEMLLANTTSQNNRVEALRGLVRSYALLKDFAGAHTASRDLLAQKGISTDDKAIANLVLGKSLQANNDCTGAINAFKAVAAINKSAWGAQARYEAAQCYFTGNSLTNAEKWAMAVIKETGSYDEWATKSYILLGDIFMQQKDYFNAKATYESVAKYAVIAELKAEAQRKYQQALEQEKAASKIE